MSSLDTAATECLCAGADDKEDEDDNDNDDDDDDDGGAKAVGGAGATVVHIHTIILSVFIYYICSHVQMYAVYTLMCSVLICTVERVSSMYRTICTTCDLNVAD